MKRAVLVTPILSKVIPFDDCEYIGVDAGAMTLLKENYPISLAVGDFDSMDQDSFTKLQKQTKIERHPVMKNETDSELAIRLCDEQGYDEIILEGGLSGRIDHTLANIRLLMYRFPNLTILDEKQKITCLTEGNYTLENKYKHISFFAIEPTCLSLHGFLYPLEKSCITPSDVFTVSNSIVKERADIVIHSGKVLCIQSNFK